MSSSKGKKHAVEPQEPAGEPNTKKPKTVMPVKNPAGSTKKPAKTPAKTPAKALTKPKKVKLEEEKTVGKRGRKLGSTAYQEIELIKLLSFINEKLPIGGAGWDWVASQYNGWAKRRGHCERAAKALRCKYDAVCIST